MRTLAELAQEAIDIQDTSNLVGVSLGFHEMLVALRDALEAQGICADTKTVSRHPITLMWMSKMVSLSGYEEQYFHDYYKQCRDIAGITY